MCSVRSCCAKYYSQGAFTRECYLANTFTVPLQEENAGSDAPLDQLEE